MFNAQVLRLSSFLQVNAVYASEQTEQSELLSAVDFHNFLMIAL